MLFNVVRMPCLIDWPSSTPNHHLPNLSDIVIVMDSFRFPHFPQDKSFVQFALFRRVENAGQLRSRIIKASTLAGKHGARERDAVNMAFLDARLVCLSS